MAGIWDTTNINADVPLTRETLERAAEQIRNQRREPGPHVCHPKARERGGYVVCGNCMQLIHIKPGGELVYPGDYCWG